MATYPKTEKFLKFCEENEFQIHNFIVPAKDQPDDEYKSLVLEIYKFPFDIRFVGTKLTIGKMEIHESETDGMANVEFDYNVVDNPNGLDILSDSDDNGPKETDDDQLMVALVSKIIDTALHDMADRFESERKEKDVDDTEQT
jgi:hypothetical protein